MRVTTKRKIKKRLHHINRHIGYVGHGRLARLTLAGAILFTVMMPVLQQINIQKSYALDKTELNLVGSNNQNLVKKFSFDASRSIWQFNKEGAAATAAASNLPAPVVAQLKMQVGGGGKKSESLYSVDLNTDPTKGITYYDNNTNLSFTMVPKFKAGEGREQQGRIVYPFKDGGKLVYTAKNNGMKEDIVLSHNIGDELNFGYQLKLPDTLTAKIQDDGSIGIFSADPALFQASASNSMDQAKLADAQKNGDKNHLLFGIPAPVVVQSGSKVTNPVNVRYNIDGKTLNVSVTGLKGANYPLAIDPSVVITSTSDFATNGNNEGNIDFSTSNQISRGAQTGGGVGSWASAGTAFTNTRSVLGSATYNGYIYIAGGYTGSTDLSEVRYATLNSNGTIGSWTLTTSLPAGKNGLQIVPYNGYMYLVGGSFSNTTYYVAINSDGSLGASWTSTSTFTTARSYLAATAYNNYLYVLGGYDGTSYLNTVQYAPMKADGSLGSFSSTTSFTTNRTHFDAVAYNGYMYVAGGNSGTVSNNVEYASIKADGTLNSWVDAGINLPASLVGAGTSVYNGYLYVFGGYTGSYANTVYYTPLHSDGSIGPFISTTTFSTGRAYFKSAAYNGYTYVLGGWDGTSYRNDIQYAKINSPGEIGGETSATTTSLNPVQTNCVVTYNGYIYSIGGYTSSGQTRVDYTTLDSTTGNTGSWSTTSALGTAVYAMGCATYNEFIYVVGGNTSGSYTNKIQYAAINSNGSLGSWAGASGTTLPDTMGNHQVAIYNGYLYVVMNVSSGGGSATNDITYAAINSDGSIVNTWTSDTAALSANRQFESVVVYAGYIYVIGGVSSGGTGLTSIDYAKLNDDGSIGTWGTTSATNVAHSRTSAVVVNGYVYVIAGDDGTGDIDDIEYAKVNSDGTLGTWTTSAVGIAETRARMGVASYGDKIYMIAGRTNGTRAATSQYFTVNAGGSQLAQSWTSNSPDISGIYSSGWAYGGAAVYNGYFYIVGGYYSGTLYADVYYAPINTDGSLGSWTHSSHSLNTARYSLGVVVYNNIIYAIAGQGSGSTRYTDYEYATLPSSGGDLASAWTKVTTNNLGTGRNDFGSTVYNGYVYVAGGQDSSSADIRDVNYASINSDGTLGSWTNVSGSSAFTTARHGLQLQAYNGYLYVIGGKGGANYLSDVQYIALNSDGSLSGSWKYADDMPTPRAEFGASIADGYMYFWAGTNSSGGQNNLMSAEMAASGTVTNWTKVNTFTTQRYSAAYAMNDGFVYFVGGKAGSSWMKDVQYTGLKSIARKAVYSKLIDIGTAGYINSISYNGTLPGGLKVLSYRTAPSGGSFGSLNLADNIALPTPEQVCASAANGRYIWLSVTLYDGGIYAVQPDESSTKASVTDITINYTGAHPTPDQRLYGGKFFLNQVLQPLDTCKP